jgi:ABC-2 type transport system permease protein
MTLTIVLAVAALAVAARLWRRRRGRSTASRPRPFVSVDALVGDVGLVAAREVRERFRNRVFRVGTVVILVAVAAAIVIPVLRRGQQNAQHVGVVGGLDARLRAAVVATGTRIGSTVQLVPEPNEQAADNDLRSGRIDLVIVDGHRLVVNRAIRPTDTTTTALLERTVSNTVSLLHALEAGQHLPAPLPVTHLQPAAKVVNGTTRTTLIVGGILVFVMLTQYTTWTLIGVMEEKSSRVVEVLLATVRPVQLLAGKVLGIGLVALAQAALIVAFALGLAEAVGSDLLRGAAPLELVSALVWLVLGYAFYSWVYAAAGSLAERQEQAQSLAFPLSLPMLLGYIMAITVAGSGKPSTFFEVLAYLPPTAPFAMPVLVGLGKVTWWEVAAAATLSVLATVAVARLAAGIYRRAILRTGQRVRLREVITHTAS